MGFSSLNLLPANNGLYRRAEMLARQLVIALVGTNLLEVQVNAV